MDVQVVGKELIYNGNELNKSRFSLPVLDVLAEKRVGAEVESYDVYAITEQERVQIGLVTSDFNWIGSRDFQWTDGKAGRIFYGVQSGPSIDADIKAFKDHWTGTTIFLEQALPSRPTEAGEIRYIGGDSVLVQAWLRQSEVWMELTLYVARNPGIDHINIAFVLVALSIELDFKALAWIKGIDISSTHKIRPFYEKFDIETRKLVDSVITEAGWRSANEFLNYVDKYLDPVNRRYFGVNLKKEFRGLNINIADNRIDAVREVHQRLHEIMKPMLR